ncbi:MAG: peptide-methionine (S)-S-oxide reductase MsrA [Candidatus Levybacteria bacterium]|nr:peptide-methionine (S)-S-oxide reductase MsrA [Candidatus Levybacteria bacterium]
MAQVQKATFANGCFWCTEAVFQRLKGVVTVASGYAGGSMENPTYEDVHYKDTGHAEAIQLTYDPAVISYETLLNIFFATHDPTTLNRDGANIGTEYRSEIFYATDDEKEIAEKVKAELDSSGAYDDPIMTAITPYTNFYPAEDQHKNYYDSNPDAPYCRVIIDPKIHKLLTKYAKEVKEEYR